jgi:hypothetical protein
MSLHCVLFCVAFMMSCQFIVMVLRISSVHFVPRLLLLLLLPSVNPNIKSFSSESDVRIMCPKYFNLSITAKVSRECQGLIYLITDAFVLLAVHGILSNLFHVHSSKASRFLLSAFINVQLSHPYSTAGKIIVCTNLTFVLVETPESHNFCQFCHC